jgi:hypothetical protein
MEESEEQKRINAEVQRQVNEALQEYARILATASTGITNLTGKVNSASTANTQSMARQTEATGRSVAMQEAAAKATDDYNKAMGNLAAATQSAVTGAKQLGSAFLSTEQGFSKFGKALESAGDAAFNLGKMIGGPLGLAVGALLKGATMVAEAALKQADNTLKATDSLSKLGGAGSFTAAQVLDMGHKAGLTSANLEVMTKAAGRANTGLAGMGSTVSGGMKAFGDMVAVSKEQRMAFQRMGVSQEELMNQQADYVKLQEISGINLADQAKTGKNLKAASLEYAENLLRLSAITGKSADELTKEKIIANEVYEEQIQTQMEQAKIRQLREGGFEDEAKDLQRQQDNRKRAAQEYVASFGKEQGLQMARAVRTGSFDKSTAGLATMGFDPAAEKRKLEEAKSKEDVDRLTAATREDMKKKREDMLLSMGTAVQYGGEKLGKQVGLGSSETAQAYGRMGSRDEAAVLKDAQNKTGGTAEGKGGGVAANDPAQIARNKLTETEIAAKVALDKMLASVNPLLNGFNATTIAATALTAAAVLAAGALGAMALKSKMGDLLGKGGDGFEKGKKVLAGGKAMGTLGKLAGGASRFAAPVAGAVAIGAGAIHAYQGYNKVEEDVAAGKLTKEQGTVKKSEAVGEGAGQAVGGAGGAWAGAAAGAAIGSVVPVVGTAIGGIIGAALGGWLGSKGGEFVGKAAGTATGQMLAKTEKEATNATLAAVGPGKDKKPMSAEDVLKDAEAKAKLQIDQTKATSTLDGSNKGLKKSIDDLKTAIDDLTTVASIKDATGTDEDKKKKLENIYKRLGIGTLPDTGTAGGGAPSGGGGGGAPSGGGSATPAPSEGGGGGSRPAAGASGPGDHSDAASSGSSGPPKLARVSSKSGKSTAVNEKFAPAFQSLIDHLDKSGYDINSLGGFVDRDVRGKPGVKSVHAHGGAIDINPATNPLGTTLVTDMPADVSSVAAGLGLGWGGNWKSRKDAMHFSAAKSEGGSLLKASNEGVFDGPATGYDVELHRQEAVVDLSNPAEKIMKVNENEVNKSPIESVMYKPPMGAESQSDAMTAFIEEFKEFMGMKIDELKEVMEEGNGISDKILTYSKV